MLYTFSGHRNRPGQKGIIVNKSIYYKIDNVYGPSSWTVNWSMKNGCLYANDIKIGGLDTVLTDDKRTVKDVLLSKENIIANVGEKSYKGFEADYKTAKESGFTALSDYMEKNNITMKYQDNRDAHGWYGLIVNIDNAHYELDLQSLHGDKEIIYSVFYKLSKFINPIKLQLIL